jgi:flagellar hook assembly protein FlgD
VTAKVYNLAGRLVQVLCEKHPMNPGRNVVEWNGQDRTNSICPSGLYIVTVQASGQLATKTVMINNQ